MDSKAGHGSAPGVDALCQWDHCRRLHGRGPIFGPFPGNQDQTQASAVSGTSQAPVAVGAALKGSNAFGPAFHAFRWTPTGGLQDLGLTTGSESIGVAVSAGNLVTGRKPL